MNMCLIWEALINTQFNHFWLQLMYKYIYKYLQFMGPTLFHTPTVHVCTVYIGEHTHTLPAPPTHAIPLMLQFATPTTPPPTLYLHCDSIIAYKFPKVHSTFGTSITKGNPKGIISCFGYSLYEYLTGMMLQTKRHYKTGRTPVHWQDTSTL